MDTDGVFHVPAYALPLSTYISGDAQAFYKRFAQLPLNWGESVLERMKTLYPVRIDERRLAGVPTDVVIPRSGIAKNKSRVLINLHGGGFYCQRTFQLLESIPIAVTANIKVVSVDYRCAPEYRFPAATEDVATVYRELLKQYKPENIGIYGCSAGGTLTAEFVAWLQKEQLPRPGAIGIFCGADVAGGGDSRWMTPLVGTASPPPVPNRSPAPGSYFTGVSVEDPLVSPTLHPKILAKFPPTLLITGTRDFLLSPVVYAHTQLVKAGVDAELHVWEGMGHCFFFFPDIPESRDMYLRTAHFFDTHLGTSH